MKKLILLITILASFGAKAQQDLNLYYMENVTQRMYLNPAFKPKAKFFIGIPALSSIYIDHMNTTLTPNTLFETSGAISTLKVGDLKKAIKNNNYLGLSTKIDLISFGFKAKKNYFSLNITENLFFRMNLSRGLLEIPLNGNANFSQNNGTIDLNNFGVDASHYREFGLGWQRELNDKLSIGAKFKVLTGLVNVYTKKSSFKIVTDPTTFDITATGEMDIRTSGFDTTSYLSNGDINSYISNAKNLGFGLDLGATYVLNDKITLDASVVDLGFISWATDNLNYKSNNGNFVYSGLDLTEIIYAGSASSDSLDAQIDRIKTRAENEFNLTNNNDKYSSPLLTRIHLGGTYELYDTKKHGAKLGVLIQSEIYQKRLRPSFTLSYNQSVGRLLNATASYSMVNSGFNNLGLGMSLNLGALQFYVSTDNIFATQMTEFKSGGYRIAMYPSSSKKTHVHFGFNFTFGRTKKDSDGDGIVDKYDHCPDVFGLKEFNGCPDTDADGFQDSKDECPTVAGTLNGCPDTDGDGIRDSLDNCPKIAGIKAFGGCPDTDGDGIQDSKDDCPKEYGSKKYNGCPDTDGDGILDKNDSCKTVMGEKENNGCPWGDRDMDEVLDNIDKCPNEAGPIENYGCPYGDEDMDGVLDNVDKCPKIPGPKENNGCPYEDRDKDGVIDSLDNCPDVPGLKENNGCPEVKKLEKKEEEILKRAFDNLEFKSGKDVIKTSSYASLNELATLLHKKQTWKLKISGHTDNVGNDRLNMRLSEKRAKAVKAYLMANGIASERFQTYWFGETQPVADNSTREGRQRNRRVEMEVVFE